MPPSRWKCFDGFVALVQFLSTEDAPATCQVSQFVFRVIWTTWLQLTHATSKIDMCLEW